MAVVKAALYRWIQFRHYGFTIADFVEFPKSSTFQHKYFLEILQNFSEQLFITTCQGHWFLLDKIQILDICMVNIMRGNSYMKEFPIILKFAEQINGLVTGFVWYGPPSWNSVNCVGTMNNLFINRFVPKRNYRKLIAYFFWSSFLDSSLSIVNVLLNKFLFFLSRERW